jgi:hypothetical protein
MWKLLVLSLCAMSVRGQQSGVVLFKHPDFSGALEIILEDYVGYCKNFQSPIQVKSIKVQGNCVVLFSQIDCEGESATISNNILGINFSAASVKYC